MPFLKSAPPKVIRALGLGVVLTLATASAATALTVDRQSVVEGGHRFELRCGEQETHTWTLPVGAQRVEVLEPVAGQAVTVRLRRPASRNNPMTWSPGPSPMGGSRWM